MSIRSITKQVGMVAALVLLHACGGGGSNPTTPTAPVVNDPGTQSLLPTPSEKLLLTKPLSCDAVTDYVSDSISDLLLSTGYPICLNCTRLAVDLPVAVAESSVSNDAAALASGASFSDVTGTNTQESGVDELDRIEADAAGNFYMIDGRHLVIANGLPPAELREIANLDLTTIGEPRGVMLDEANSQLVVVLSGLGGITVASDAIVAPDFWFEPVIKLLFVDVSDPADPRIQRRLTMDGFQIAARRIGSRVHLVSHFTPRLPIDLTNNDELFDLQRQHADALTGDPANTDEIEQPIRDLVAAFVANTNGEDYLPKIWQQEGDADPVRLADPTCGDIATPDVSMPFALTMVTSVDTDGMNVDKLAIANNSWNVYASEQNLYLMQTSSGWWWDRRQSQQTAIFKIAIGNGAPIYQSMGMVDGWANSSYQFSEYEGNLRVATNRWERDPTEDAPFQHNNLFVLSDSTAGSVGSGALEVIGEVRGFGRDERIFSARFLGDRGYVVTFRQIDPLFAFDLSDPRNPVLAGELELPGVSTYIHPLESNHLLTIGIAGNDEGLNGQPQLQIFDVQDLADPRLLHAHVPAFAADGFAWTSALYDPHAFNFFDAAGVLTIPVQYWASRFEDHFSGFAAFKVDTLAGFTELGRLDHSDLARREYCPDPALGTSLIACDQGHYLESANPSRSVAAIFDERTYIYTLSDVGMKVSPAQDFSNPEAVLPLPYTNRYWWWATN
jgi:hypothetical protein